MGATLFISCEKDDDNGDEMQNLESTQLYASNITDGNVTVYDMITGEVNTLTTASTAAEVVYYDADRDEIIRASRSSNQLNAYAGISSLLGSVSINASFSSSSDITSPRDIAVNGNMVVVADNADVDVDETTADG